MQRYLIAVMLCASVSTATVAPSPAGAAGCPWDPAAAVRDACPCQTFRNHSQYMNCVKRQTQALEKSGCDKNAIGEAMRCASMSTCGESKVVCCTAGRAQTLPANRCTGHGGTIMTGTTSPCDVSCTGAAVPNPLPVPQGSTTKEGRKRRVPHHKPPAGQQPYPSQQQLPPGQTQ